MDIDARYHLLAFEHIAQLKARYCRYIDTKQWEALRGLFTAATRFEGFGSAPSGADADTFVAGIRNRLGPVTSIHHCHMPEIAFTGPDSARGIWAMMDYLQWPAEVPKETGFFGYGHYEEEYVRTPDGWRFGFLRLTRLRMDPLPPGHVRSLPGLLAHRPDWLENGRN